MLNGDDFQAVIPGINGHTHVVGALKPVDSAVSPHHLVKGLVNQAEAPEKQGQRLVNGICLGALISAIARLIVSKNIIARLVIVMSRNTSINLLFNISLETDDKRTHGRIDVSRHEWNLCWRLTVYIHYRQRNST